MKTLILLGIIFNLTLCLQAQSPLPRDEALRQLYHEYDSSRKTAQWVCKEDDGIPCWKGAQATVSITPLLLAELNEGGIETIYVVASAKPANEPFDCHGCAPAIGAAVFRWTANHWKLESANPATGTYSGWGEPPDVDLVSVGPKIHGLMLSMDDLAQGYSSSLRVLLVEFGGTVKEVWRVGVEEDDLGAYDPTDRFAEHVAYHSSAGIRFFANDEQDAEPRKYYDIEVVSRGKDRKGKNVSIKPENWTEIYRFKNGKYQLLTHKEFTEIRKPKSIVEPR